MTATAFDVALGADDAVTVSPPRLDERLTAAWHALGTALSQGHIAVAAPQLAFLARHRLVAPPPDTGRAQQLARLLGTAQLTDPALLLLARWAHSSPAQASSELLQQLVTATLDAQASGVASAGPAALFLAATTTSRACAPAVQESSWSAAVDILERRRQDIRVPEGLAACGYLAASATDAPRVERAVFAALFLACTPSAPVSEPPPLSSALLCFRLFSALSASGAPGVQQALASAAGHPDVCETPAAVLACAGVVYSTPPPPIGDMHVGQALHQIIVHAAEAALMQDNDLSLRRAALTSSVALATSRLLASAGTGSQQQAHARASMVHESMLQCVASAVFHPHTGAAMLPIRALEHALSAATLPLPPHIVDATLSRALQHPVVAEAGALVRLLCNDTCARLAVPGAERSAVVMLDAVCMCAAASHDVYRSVARAVPATPPKGSGPLAWSPAVQLSFLCVSAFFVGTKDIYCSAKSQAVPGAAGQILDALARVDVGRTHHGASPPVGYGILLESAVRRVSMHPQDASALMRGIPAPSELQAGHDVAMLARSTFILRALPFVLPVVLTARKEGLSSAADMMHQLTQVVVPFSLVFATSASTGQQACRAAHLIMRAVLAAVPAADFPDKGAVAEAYARSTLDAYQVLPADILTLAFDAALRAMPPQQAAGGSPHLALLNALATRVHETSSRTDAGETARPLRIALFRTLGAMPPRLLNEALPIYDAAVRSLPANTSARQEAVDSLCSACSSIDVYHKRRCVDWCLRLAASL